VQYRQIRDTMVLQDKGTGMSTITKSVPYGPKTKQRTIDHYLNLKVVYPSAYRQCMSQYRDMARGGDGGQLPCVGEPVAYDRQGSPIWVTCRDRNYRGYPDSFFQEVLEALGEVFQTG